MNKRKRKIILTAFLMMAVVSASTWASLSYAWYMDTASTEPLESAMATVDVSIVEGDVVANNGVYSFSISNKSNIDTYLRLGWTPVYRSGSTDTTKDITGITVEDVTVSLTGCTPVAGKVTSWGYDKNMIIMENGSGKYLRVPANTDPNGTVINGTITLDGVDTQGSEVLHLLLAPEAIQATWRAVNAGGGVTPYDSTKLADYGWDPNKVDAQDATIILPTPTPNEGGGNP